MQTNLTPDELDLLSHECDNQTLTIAEQGVKDGRRYTVATGNRGLFLTVVTRTNGLVEVRKAEQTTIEDALDDAFDTSETETVGPREGRDSVRELEARLGESHEAALVAAGIGENPDENGDPLGHLPDLGDLALGGA